MNSRELYLIGIKAKENGNTKAAINIFTKIVNDFPNSSEAELASNVINDLNSTGLIYQKRKSTKGWKDYFNKYSLTVIVGFVVFSIWHSILTVNEENEIEVFVSEGGILTDHAIYPEIMYAEESGELIVVDLVSGTRFTSWFKNKSNKAQFMQIDERFIKITPYYVETVKGSYLWRFFFAGIFEGDRTKWYKEKLLGNVCQSDFVNYGEGTSCMNAYGHRMYASKEDHGFFTFLKSSINLLNPTPFSFLVLTMLFVYLKNTNIFTRRG